MLLVSLLRSSPAIMKLWPEPSSTVVSARRVVERRNLEAVELDAAGVATVR